VPFKSSSGYSTLFQHTAARRRLENRFIAAKSSIMFQHTAARRRLGPAVQTMPACRHPAFQHTAARRRLGYADNRGQANEYVSTHSRPKAAGVWDGSFKKAWTFQHTAARRRLDVKIHQSADF